MTECSAPNRPEFNAESLAGVLSDAWGEWNRAVKVYGPGVIPESSAPVLWFGNLNRYLASPRRIVTIGVNPGPNTFPRGNPWQHYATPLDPMDRSLQAYARAMGEFPLNEWFPSWNGLLEPFGARYPSTDGSGNTPLHVDLTPLTTLSGFAAVNEAARNGLLRAGLPLLERLLDSIMPDVSFLSVRKEYFDIMRETLAVSDAVPWNCRTHGGVRAIWSCPGELLWLRKTGAAPISAGREVQAVLGKWMRVAREPTRALDEPDFKMLCNGARTDGATAAPVAQRAPTTPPAKAGSEAPRPVMATIVAALKEFVNNNTQYLQLDKRNGATLNNFLPKKWAVNASAGKFSKQIIVLYLGPCDEGVELSAYVQSRADQELAQKLVAALTKKGWKLSKGQQFSRFWTSCKVVNNGQGGQSELVAAITSLVENFQKDAAAGDIDGCLKRVGIVLG